MDILSSNSPQGKPSPKQQKTLAERFWSKVDKSGECWLWIGCFHRAYGVFGITPKKKIRAHRMAWELTYGDIPTGLYICHRCNNPSCVNPEHLYPGTPQENMNDKVVANHHLNVPKGEHVTTSKLTEDQVREIRERYRVGEVSYGTLGREYGVTDAAIYLIITGQTWKQIL